MAMLMGWILFVLPWFVLIFLRPERKRRFMSATFLIIAITVICYEISARLGWWEVHERAFYFTNMNSFVFGLLPVAALVMFYLTYPNPWLYFGGNLALDAVQCFLIAPYVLEKAAGLFEMKSLGYPGLYLLLTLVAALIFFYQKWFEHGKSYDTEPPLEEWLRRWSFRQRAR